MKDRPKVKPIAMTVGLTIGLLLICAAWGPPAQAGTYVMRNCNVPGHAGSLLYPWQVMRSDDTDIWAVDGCAAGDGFAAHVNDSGQVGFFHGVTILLAKPTGARSDIKFVKFVAWYAARLAGLGQPLHFTTQESRADGSLHLGLSNEPPGSESVMAEHTLSPDTKTVFMTIQCGRWGVPQSESCVAAHSVPWLLRGVEVTLSEDVPPIVLPPGGSLLAGGPQSGIRTLTFSVSDAQSGLSSVDVLLGETVVARHDLRPRCPHSDFTVCPPAEDGTLQIDTRAVPNGPHPLTLRAHDAAGNERVVHGDNPVEVANPPTPAPAAMPSSNGSGYSSGYSLSARLKGTSRSTITVNHGRRISVSGRLTQGSQPIATGTAIDVLERLDRRRARWVRRAGVKTKAGGSFSAVLATTRPSRSVRVEYRPADGRRVVSRTLRVRVRAASRVRASLRGRTVRFSGTVLSRPIPKKGKRVLMEGRAPGSAWTTFKSLRTDRKGRFSGTYRLRVLRPGVRLKIRSVVRSEGGYGYLTSRSPAVSLRVR